MYSDTKRQLAGGSEYLREVSPTWETAFSTMNFTAGVGANALLFARWHAKVHSPTRT
jgi:hypothetical protein